MASASNVLIRTFSFSSDLKRLLQGLPYPQTSYASVKGRVRNSMFMAKLAGGNASLGLAEKTDDLFVRKTLLHGDVPMLLMKTILTS